MIGRTIAVSLAIVFAVAIARECRAQDCREGDYGCGHQENHEHYKSWARPSDGLSCCHEGDCRPTRARPADNESGWEAWADGQWVPVPKAALLPPDMLGDGRNHYCGPRTIDIRTGKLFPPYCFSPTGPKS